jgi:hypothetical protein
MLRILEAMGILALLTRHTPKDIIADERVRIQEMLDAHLQFSNGIPEDIDCHKPASWIRDALFQPEPRARYRTMLELGYIDAFRSLHPGVGGQFTFWDYFRQAFEHNRGIRIDHFLLTPSLVKRLQSCEIDKGARTLEKPSDHTDRAGAEADLSGRRFHSGADSCLM